MNPEQAAREIKARMEAITWPAGTQSLVFGSNGRVKIYAGSPTEDQIPNAFPFCLVGINSGTPDPEQHGFLSQQFTVTAAALVAGDPMGEFAVSGGGTADVGSSAGKGVMELAERIRNSLKDVIGVDGVKIRMNLSSTETPVNLSGRHLVTNDTIVTMRCTSDLYYAPPQQLKLTGSTWTWQGADHCRGRHDFVSYALAYVTSGTDPAADWADHTQVETSVATETINHTAVPGRRYAIFAEYNRHGKSGETAIVGRSRGDRVGAMVLQ